MLIATSVAMNLQSVSICKYYFSIFLHSDFAIHVSIPFICLSCVSLRSLDWTLVHEAVGYTAKSLLSVFNI